MTPIRKAAGIALAMLATAVSASGADDRALAQRILADDTLDTVRRMAEKTIASGFSAGDGYQEIWIRDFATFMEVACAVHPADTVKDTLRLFFHFQGEDGNIIDGYVGKAQAHGGYAYRHSATAPDFLGHKNTVETDQESSLVLAVHRYVWATGDRAFLDESILGERVVDRLARALDYVRTHRFSTEYGLVWGATTADWGDVQPEHEWGVELDASSHRAIDIYDNALYLSAIDALLTTKALPPDAAAGWRAFRKRVADNVREHLWDAPNQKFIPHIYLEGSPFPADFDENQIHYHGGTTEAIGAGLLTRDEIRHVLGQMRANVEAAGAASIGLTLYPPYPEGFFKNPILTKPYTYQNGGDWTWFGGRLIQYLVAEGFIADAYRELRPMTDRASANDGFYEWYTRDNQPHGSGTYRGSAGVLWKAITGLQTWARATDPPEE